MTGVYFRIRKITSLEDCSGPIIRRGAFSLVEIVTTWISKEKEICQTILKADFIKYRAGQIVLLVDFDLEYIHYQIRVTVLSMFATN